MSKPILRAQPKFQMAESKVRPAVLSFFRAIAPAYLRVALRFRSIRVPRSDTAVEALRSFQEGKSRLLIVFRHPYGDEPQLLASVIARVFPAAARRAGKALRGTTHAHFVHGYEVPLWSGAAIRWILPRAGAVPVYHVKFDSASVSRLRSLMLDGPYPLALAPEGQVSYSSETLPRLENGFAHIALWCADDLAKAKRTEQVLVLPLSVHHRYGRDAKKALGRLLSTMEKDCALDQPKGLSSYQRLTRIARAIVAEAELFYRELEETAPRNAEKQKAALTNHADAEPDSPEDLNRRWKTIVESALAAGERALGTKNESDLIQRVYRLRQTGWDRVYRKELPLPGDGKPSPSPLRRSLMDRVTAEAWYAMRHMELADIGFYIDFTALKETDPIELYMESANNYRDLISRLRGGNITDRGNPALKDAVVITGEPLIVKPVSGDRMADRRAAINDLSNDLAQRFLECVDFYRKEYRHGE